METNNVIDDLVKDLRPVKPIPPLTTRMGLWMTAGAIATSVLVFFVAAHRDLELGLRSSRLVLDVGAVLLLAITAGWAALRLSVPGEENVWTHEYLPMGLLSIWVLLSVVQVAGQVASAGVQALIPDRHVACALLTAGAGGLLMIPMGLLIRSAAPLDPRWCGAVAGLAVGSAAMVGVEFICVFERPAHFAAYHVLPVALFTVAGALAGPKFLKAA